MEATITYSDSNKGWTSFYSYIPEYMVSCNNVFYTFKGGNIYKHNSNNLRNNFYGQQYGSSITSVFNDYIIDNKLFKTIYLQGTSRWEVDMETDLQYTGFIDAVYFEKKEAVFFAFVRNSGDVPADPSEYPLRSVNGIGRSISINTAIPSAVEVNFSTNPLIEIGQIISIGDLLYYSLPPYTTPVLFGQVTNIDTNYPTNRLVVNTTITGGNIPLVQSPYIMFIKNSVAESHGVLGHYCKFTITNNDTTAVELFTVESDMMKSFP